MDNPKEKTNQKNIKNYLIFSGIAFEMIVIIGLGAWFGHYLDDYFAYQDPILTLVFMLISVFMSIFMLIKRLKKIN